MPETLQQILTLHVATSDEIKLLCDMLWMNNFAFYKERESFLRWAIKNYVYIYNYCPQTKFAKVMFSQVSVYPRGDVCRTPTPQQTHSPGQTHTPRADPPRQTHPPLGRHTLLWADTHPPLGRPPPWADPPGQTPLCPVHAGIHTPPAQCKLGYGQQAGGMYPIEMHSCWWFFLVERFLSHLTPK